VNQEAIDASGSDPTATWSHPIVARASEGKRARTAASRVSSESPPYGSRIVRVRDGGDARARSLAAAPSSREILREKSDTDSPSRGRTSTTISPASRTAEKSSETSTLLAGSCAARREGRSAASSASRTADLVNGSRPAACPTLPPPATTNLG
jgi:hypothetical protein